MPVQDRAVLAGPNLNTLSRRSHLGAPPCPWVGGRLGITRMPRDRDEHQRIQEELEVRNSAKEAECAMVSPQPAEESA